MTRRRRLAWVVLAGVLLAAVALGTLYGPAIWDHVTLRRVHMCESPIPLTPWFQESRHSVCGWYTERWFPLRYLHGPARLWYRANGYLATEDWYEGGEPVRQTGWFTFGAIGFQIDDGANNRALPPWLWGVTDQTEPTAPWC